MYQSELISFNHVHELGDHGEAQEGASAEKGGGRVLDGAALGMGGGDDGAGMMQAAAEQPPPVDLRGENPLMAFVRTMLPWVNVGEMTDEQLEGLAQQVLAAQAEGDGEGEFQEDFDE